MKKIIKWLGLVIALVVLVSLFYYVKEKKNQPVVSSDELLKMALIDIRERKDYPRAITLLRRALTASPKYADIQVTLGRAYLLNGNLDSAKKYLLSAIVLDIKNADARLYLVNISMQQKDTLSAIGYIDQYLQYYPGDEKIWLKKYILLLQHGEYASAERVYRSFSKQFSEDTIRIISFNEWRSIAEAQRKNGDLARAYESYRKALAYQHGQPEVLQQLINLAMQYRDYRAAERYNKLLLKRDSTHTPYLINASAIYAKLNNYEQAALYAARAYKLNPTIKARNQLADFYLALAKNANPEDKIRYATQVLQLLPAHKETLLYVINGNLDLNQYAEALRFTNQALDHYPSDGAFINKKIGILYDTKNYAIAAAYLETVLQQRLTAGFIRAYDELQLLIATDHIRDKKWDDALMTIQKGLAYNKNNKALLEQQLTVYASTDRTFEAIALIDRLIVLSPGNPDYLFKKAGLLEKVQRFEEAADISYALYRQYPGMPLYKKAYLYELANAEKQQVQQQQWDKAIVLYNKAAAEGNPGYFSILYALTAYTEKGDRQHVLSLTDTALSFFPNDSLFLVKRSLAYQALTFFPEALTLGKELLNRYPSDTSLQKMYLDQLLTAGKYYERENKNDSALNIFFTAFAFAPNDTFALQNLSAIYFVKKQYDSSIYYANLGLALDSNNEYLLMKKASAYEQLKDYKSAYASASRLLQVHATKNLSDYAAYLKGKTYMNQLGITHLQSSFSSASQYASVTGIQYMRRFKKGSVAAKLNIGNRPAGTGVQAGLDAYYTHDTVYYSNAFVNASPGTAFPYWQAGYSLFRSFKKGWEGELGARYLGFDSIHNYTAVAAVGKYINSTWLNIRGFYTYDNNNWYPSYLLTLRQYLNDKNEYFSAIAGLGRTPDDPSLAYNINNFKGFASKTIGVGFQKNFRYNTILNASFNYTNLQVAPRKTLNQYDIYLTLLRNF